MNFFSQLSIAITAALLAACGGGGSSGAPVAMAPTVISNTDATTGLGLAKNSNILFISDLVMINDNVDLLRVITQTGGSLGAQTISCGSSGSFTMSVTKAGTGMGLAAGDYLQISYNNCAYSTGPTLSGSVKVSALTTTNSNLWISSTVAPATYSLPYSVNMVNFTQIPYGTANISTYNGTVNFPTYSYNSNVASVFNATSSSLNVVRQLAIGSVLSSIYTDAIFNLSDYQAGVDSWQTAYSLTASVNSGVPISLSVASDGTGDFFTPTSLNLSVTNYLGGKITGNKLYGSSTVNVSIDNGNDGSIVSTFAILYSAI